MQTVGDFTVVYSGTCNSFIPIFFSITEIFNYYYYSHIHGSLVSVITKRVYGVIIFKCLNFRVRGLNSYCSACVQVCMCSQVSSTRSGFLWEFKNMQYCLVVGTLWMCVGVFTFVSHRMDWHSVQSVLLLFPLFVLPTYSKCYGFLTVYFHFHKFI